MWRKKHPHPTQGVKRGKKRVSPSPVGQLRIITPARIQSPERAPFRRVRNMGLALRASMIPLFAGLLLRCHFFRPVAESNQEQPEHHKNGN